MDRDRGRHAGGVAGVDAGLLDVLHDASDVDILSVRDGVHVDLGVVLHELVDQSRMPRTGARAGPEVEVEVLVVVDDLHPAPAEYVRGPHDDGIPELARHLPRLLGGRCRPEPGMRDTKLGETPSEPGAVLCEVDGVRRGTEYLCSRRFKLMR